MFDRFLVAIVIHYQVIVCLYSVFLDCAFESSMSWEIFGDSFANHAVAFIAKCLVSVVTWGRFSEFSHDGFGRPRS